MQQEVTTMENGVPPRGGNLPAFEPSVQPRQAFVETGSAREMAEVQAAVVMAKRFPRDQQAAMDRIMVACQRPTLAAQAVYQYSRGGSDVKGPSIRLAEALAQAWGNIQYGMREVEQRDGESTMLCYAWDLESGTRVERSFQVKHERHTRSGKYALEDPRDIYELGANQGSRRVRACLLQLLPGDVVEAAVEQCERTLHADVDLTPERLTAMVNAFGEFGVTRDQIEKRLQRRLDTMTPAQFVGLRRIYTSLKDGVSVPSDFFEGENGGAQAPPETPSGNEQAKAALGVKPKAEAPPPSHSDEYEGDPPSEDDFVPLDGEESTDLFPGSESARMGDPEG